MANKTFRLKPHSDKQKKIMTAFLTPHLREVVVACGTKFGKTLGAGSAIAAGLWVKKNKIYRWVAPIYSQSKIGKRYLQKLLPQDTFEPKNDTPPTLRLPATNSIVEFWHAQDPESLEGEGVSGGYVFDEFAKMRENIYASARTTISQTRAPMLFTSTPKGKNHFYQRAMAAKEKMEWDLKKGNDLTHIFITASTEDNPFVPKETIEEARNELPDRLYRQYFRSEFLDDADVFVGFRDSIIEMDPVGVGTSKGLQFWYDDKCDKKDVVIGVDWGKVTDYTVFGAIDYRAKKPRLCAFMRFNGISYIQAIKELVQFTRKFRTVGLINHDMTGMGQPLDDMLAQVNLPVQGITFTNKSKSDMVNQLILAFQKKEIELPNWPDMILELDAYEVQTTAVGNYRYSAPEGSGIHDDIVSMLMLAISAFCEYAGDFNVRILEDLPTQKDKMTLNKWYTDIIIEEADSPFPFE